MFNSGSLGQKCRHFADDISRRIVVNAKFCILIDWDISEFVPKGPIDNSTPLV